MERIKAFLGSEWILPVSLAVIGGIIRRLRSGRCSSASLIFGMAMAGFVGVLAHLALQDVAMSAGLKSAIVGVAGYAGGDLLNAASRKVCVMVGMDDRKKGE